MHTEFRCRYVCLQLLMYCVLLMICDRYLCVKSYDRRGKVVKEGWETELWFQVPPEMMSEEEVENGIFVCHPPSYRSDSFIYKLEYQLDNLPSMSHLRAQRRLGSPIKSEDPRGYKSWLLAAKDSEEN